LKVAEEREEKLGYLGSKRQAAAASMSGVRTELDAYLDAEAASGSGLGGGLRDSRDGQRGASLLVGLDW
jgi:hypothetical protein